MKKIDQELIRKALGANVSIPVPKKDFPLGLYGLWMWVRQRLQGGQHGNV